MKTNKSIIIVKCVLFILHLFLHSSSTVTVDENSNRDNSGKIRIIYQFQQQALKYDTLFIVTDTMALEVDPNYSIYYDFHLARRDSVNLSQFLSTKTFHFTSDHEELEKILQLQGSPDEIISDREGESARIFKNRSIQEIITVDRDNDKKYKFVVKENISQDWKISSDTLTILNYVCMKATTHFRGRTYTAWFTVDIPLNDGPWKIYGLPGTILKVEDSENVFSFIAIGLEKINDFFISRELVPTNQRINITYSQFNNYKKQLHKKISYGFRESGSSVIFFSNVDNPVIYRNMEIE